VLTITLRVVGTCGSVLVCWKIVKTLLKRGLVMWNECEARIRCFVGVCFLRVRSFLRILGVYKER